jgi:cytochrome c oxidase subunit 4
MPSQEDQAERAELKPLLCAWLLLIVLGCVEFVASYLHLPREFRPLIMVPGVLMVVAVALAFMEVRRGPVLVRAFAVAGLFWLLVLLGLGSADPLTRTDYRVPHAHVN